MIHAPSAEILGSHAEPAIQRVSAELDIGVDLNPFKSLSFAGSRISRLAV